MRKFYNIGETFAHGDKLLIVVPQQSAINECSGCEFRDDPSEVCKSQLCASYEREDKEDVIFLRTSLSYTSAIFHIEFLKSYISIHAGKLIEPILKQGKNPKEDAECQKAFIILAHLKEIEDYLKEIEDYPRGLEERENITL